MKTLDRSGVLSLGGVGGRRSLAGLAFLLALPAAVGTAEEREVTATGPEALVRLSADESRVSVTIPDWYICRHRWARPRRLTVEFLQTLGALLEAGKEAKTGVLINLIMDGHVYVDVPSRGQGIGVGLDRTEKQAKAVMAESQKGWEKFWEKRLGQAPILEVKQRVGAGPGESRTFALGDGYTESDLKTLMNAQVKAARVFLGELDNARSVLKALKLLK